MAEQDLTTPPEKKAAAAGVLSPLGPLTVPGLAVQAGKELLGVEDEGLEQEKALGARGLEERDAKLKALEEFDVTGGGRGRQIFTRPRGVNEALAAPAEREPIGSQTTTVSRPRGSPEGLGRAIDIEAEMMAAVIDAQAAGMNIRSNAFEDLALAQQENVFPILQSAQAIFDDANRQLSGVQEMADDVRSNRINPGQFFANVGEAGKFAGAMAAAAGHLAAALGGGPNTALNVINGAIERTMRSQELNQAHDRAVLNANIMIFDRMRTLGVDRLNQGTVYNALLISQAQSALEAIGASSASTGLQAQLGVIQAQLAQKREELFLRFAGTIQSRTQMALFAEQSSAQETAKANLRQNVATVLEASAGQPPEERLNLLQQLQAQTGTAVDEALIADIQSSDAGLQGVDPTKFQVPSTTDVVKWTDPVTGEEFQKITNARFRELPEKGKESKEATRRQMEAQFRYAQNWQRLAVLGSRLQAVVGADTLRSLLATEKGQFKIVGVNASPEVTEFRIRANEAVAQNQQALSGRMEAIRGPGEQAILAKRAGLPSSGEALASILFGGDDMFDLLGWRADIIGKETAVDIGKFTE